MINKIKYPLEIEFTNHCGLKCISCISRDLDHRGFISRENFEVLMNFLDKNLEDIKYITFWWLWDNLLHKDILYFLDRFKVFSSRNLNILIPTKWNALTQEIILKIKELKKAGLNINIQIGIFSLREKVQNFMSGLDADSNFNYFQIFKNQVKYLKKVKLDFALELLLTKFSENEVDNFYKFCNTIWVDWVVHRLHTFWGKLKTYEDLYSNKKDYDAFHCSYNESEKDDSNDYYHDKCWFFPYIDWSWTIYPWTFCTHYNIWKLEDFVYYKSMDDIVNNCSDRIDLQNKYCLKCVDNPINNLKN